jgi:hypothetical protein
MLDDRLGLFEPAQLVRELHVAPLDEDGRWRPHHYVGRRGKRARCEACGAAYVNGLGERFKRGDPRAVPPMIHHAYPESFNAGGGSTHDVHGYQRANEAWQHIFTELLEPAELPRPMARVLVEGEWTFPQRYGRGPDQENFRYPCSKFLGDALQLGGWLENDWWEAYEFGGAVYRREPGVRRLRLMVFPTVEETPFVGRQESLSEAQGVGV